VCAWFGIGVATAARRLVPSVPGTAAACLALMLVLCHASSGGVAPAPQKQNPAGGGGWLGEGWLDGAGALPADCVGSDLFDQYGAEMLRVIPEGEGVLLLTYGDEVRGWGGHRWRCLRVNVCVCVLGGTGLLSRSCRAEHLDTNTQTSPRPPSLS
jgi:hypothetical protein